MQVVEGTLLKNLTCFFLSLIYSVSVSNALFFKQKLLEAHEEQNSEAFTEAVSKNVLNKTLNEGKSCLISVFSL